MQVFPVDDYVARVLMRDLAGHDRSPSSFVVYLFLWYSSIGRGERTTRLSLQKIAIGTGLAKTSVQLAVAHLVRRKLLRVTKASATAIPEYRVLRPWARRQQS